jgi:hypothetical protein
VVESNPFQRHSHSACRNRSQKFWFTPYFPPKIGGYFCAINPFAWNFIIILAAFLGTLIVNRSSLVGVADHVHILFTLSRTHDVSSVIKEVKRGSSVWIKTKSPEMSDFGWQNGYGIFSIGFSQIGAVRDYIARQEEHHKKTSFQDEFRQLLQRYEIEFDERYVWD